MKTFFKILSWLLSLGPLIYSLIVHDWGMLIGVLLASFGIAIGFAMKEIDKPIDWKKEMEKDKAKFIGK